MPTYKPKEDEDWLRIAKVHGFRNWRTIYDHEENAALRERQDSLVVSKDDEVFIPEKTPREHKCETGQRHTFKLPVPTQIVYLVLEDDYGEPFSGLKFEIWADGEKQQQKAERTREDGLIYEEIPLAANVEVRVWFDEESESEPEAYVKYVIQVGHLDPIDTLEGVQDRLNNLGYDCGEEEHGKLGPDGGLGELTKQALTAFQIDHGLNATGEIDEDTKKKLLAIHDGIGEEGTEKEGKDDGKP